MRDEDRLPEFTVTLQRVPKGELAVDPNDRSNLGKRTKLGGIPDWIQLIDDTPFCAECKASMTFVAQIDSIEHISLKNPIGMDFKHRDPTKRRWMFGDVGMIYVFYCFTCGKSQSVMQCY